MTDKPRAWSRTDIAERRTAPSCAKAGRMDEQVIGTGFHPAGEEAVASGAAVVAALPRPCRGSAAPGGSGR